MKAPLISVQELSSWISKKKLILLDASMDKVTAKLDANNLKTIPNSLFFDIAGTFSDQNADLPNTMLDPISFEKNIQKLGIDRDSTVVVYDQWGVYSSPRAWWMLRYMGHQETYVLNGGVKAWEDAGLPVLKTHDKPTSHGNFQSNPRPSWFEDKESVLKAVQQKSAIIVDARAAERFNGISPEPRTGLRAGHIPTSSNLSYDQVLDGPFMKDDQRLKKIFSSYLKDGLPTIFTCGSGISAAIITLAAYQIGARNISLYDGSWSEWGADPLLPIE